MAMEVEAITLIPWVALPHWTARIILGTEDVYYNFQADWNTRGAFWGITISTLDNDILIQGKKLTLGVNLLSQCHSPFLPDCRLIPITDSDIDYITQEAMIDGTVKLYHIV